MKVSDFIVQFLIEQGITDIFGYPGGMVTHLLDSLGKREKKIKTHITYHEQAAAFAACGYAQASNKVGVAFATSGPGATNLITGIGNAFFDSIPTVFITGQVNTFESKGNLGIRQKGFQETNIVSIVSEITKAAYYVDDEKKIPGVLKDAFSIALQDRKGPVLVDIPMNIFRSDIPEEISIQNTEKQNISWDGTIEEFVECLSNELEVASRPCIILGNGIKTAHEINGIRNALGNSILPVVSSMLAIDVIPEGFNDIYYGFIGTYGNRAANFIVAKSDLVICLGTRLDIRQIGAKKEQFASRAKIIRIDIDEAELDNKIHNDERSFYLPLSHAVPALGTVLKRKKAYTSWLNICKQIKDQFCGMDELEPNKYFYEISQRVSDNYNIVVDVGQHMLWTAQSFEIKPGQRMYFSGGMGSMGYALPAAIGVYYATCKPVLCFVGDGGFQMNIQEMQFLAREQLPVKIFVLNNSALGMIRHFQEMYFQSRYCYTERHGGYTVPDFLKIASAYGIKGKKIHHIDEIQFLDLGSNIPELFEIILHGNTYVFPKLEYGKLNQDQAPLLDRTLYNYLMEL